LLSVASYGVLLGSSGSYRHNRIVSYHIVALKWQNRLKVGTDKPKLEVKMQSVSDDVRIRLLEQPRFNLAVKGVCIHTGNMLHLPAGRFVLQEVIWGTEGPFLVVLTLKF